MLDKVDIIYNKILKLQQLLDNNLSMLSKKFNLNSTELMIFIDVKSHPSTDLNALCERLSIKKSLASKTVNKLINEGIITRETDEEDHRKVVLKHVDFKDVAICKETFLAETFKGVEKHSCNLENIEKSLDDVIKILSNKL